MPKDAAKMEKIVALCKRRGFIFQSSEIYGGINGFWDYGPLGVELKRNIKDAWWRDMVTRPPVGPDGRELQMVGVDCSIIMNPKVWEASGHVGGFSDPMVECRECKGRFRSDTVWQVRVEGITEAEFHSAIHITESGQAGTDKANAATADLPSEAKHARVLILPDDTLEVVYTRSEWRLYEALGVVTDSREQAVETAIATAKRATKKNRLFRVEIRAYPLAGIFKSAPIVCPACKSEATLTEPRQFNLMFQTYVGALQDASSVAYLRPETAQGIFANFKNVVDSSRVKVPFGIAQIGKAFRNEINPRNYIFRSREFEQMEIEFFCHDNDAMMWWEWWRDVRINWYKSLGLAGENLKPRNQDDKELAHYSKACTDIEYYFPFADGPQELEGVAHRGCYDLQQHAKHSGKDLTYFDDERKERFLPTVIEPSAGADRSTLAFICEAYTVDESRPSPELMKFHPRLAPIKAAVFPLVNKDGLPEIAEPIFRDIKKRWPAMYDPKQSIGKRYARMDEAGTPYCFTIDGQTKEDGTLTVRDRDTGNQQRIDKGRVLDYLIEKLG